MPTISIDLSRFGATAGTRVDTSDLADMARRFGNSKRIRAALRAAMRRVGRQLVSKIRSDLTVGARGIRSRSNRLANSFRYIVKGETSPELAVFSVSEYARIHEYGGIVTPKTRTKLAVPKDRTVRRRFRHPLDFVYPGRFIPVGCRMLIDSRTREPMFWLKSAVVIPPRLGLRDTVKTATPAIVRQIGEEFVASLISRRARRLL